MSKYIDSNGIEYYPLYVADYPDNFFRGETYSVGSNVECYAYAETLSSRIAEKVFDNGISIFTKSFTQYKNDKDEITVKTNICYNIIYNFKIDNSDMLLLTAHISGDLNSGEDYIYTRTELTGYDINIFKIIPVVIVNPDNSIAAAMILPVINKQDKGGTYRVASFLSYPTDVAIGAFYGVDYNGITINAENSNISEREFDNTNDTSQSGGYGTGTMPKDNISIPVLPSITLSDAGCSLYALTSAKIREFRDWLWSSDWQDNIKKIRTDPMQNIIGISVIDINITETATNTIHVGNIDSNIQATLLNNSFLEVDCGTITLDEYYGTFADYEPFVATTLYLPKVGFVQIPADTCVNNTIKVVYHIELTSGEGLCYVQLTSKRDGFTYVWNTYTCHVTSNITLSAQDHSQQLVALGNAIINTGISASNAIVNPASTAQGLTNTLSSCIDVATTKNPTSTKGNVGNMSAVMCYKKPYLLINRTNLTKPSSFQENNGYLINYTSTIGGHTGFLQTRNYHCSFNAPYNHRAEIERLMDGGVIINA